jgi:hypothetical protein
MDAASAPVRDFAERVRKELASEFPDPDRLIALLEEAILLRAIRKLRKRSDGDISCKIS